MTSDDGAGAPVGPVPSPRSWATWRYALRHGLILAVLWMVYTLGRAAAGRHIGRAFANSDDVWHFERWLRIPSEAALQRWALGWEPGIRAADLYYKYVHLTDFVIICAWLLLWHPERFGWFRRVIVLITGLELVGHFAYPLAPPRMRPDLGMTDTAQVFGHAVYGGSYENHGLFNQYAAMPSMHVGWSFFFAITVVTIARGRWRWIIVAHPLLMTYTVVVTGNHYWLDGIVGLLLLAIGLWLFRRDSPWRHRPDRHAPSDSSPKADAEAEHPTSG
ncbi:phosphatase PAP2 family protein [Actinomadura chibensis]|uniref:Inositol phosphorylceramide synthase n=1 Tax=Actinomadura chibensis TaxID=392828 RepID=A0A5D0NMT6_9ACTN|nr:phosphatase PAP2 family protein [Actinomadura chibensis]TYB45599.1 inositol phosphorylceramide synthase [Actinomadura chibensis]